MTSKRNISYKLLIISALLGLFTSCVTIEDPLPGNPKSEYFEFVARPISYNGQIVQTKATSVDDFENRIYNLYFLLYANDGTRVICNEVTSDIKTLRFSRHEIYSLLGNSKNCTACFVANVPGEIVKNRLNTLTALNNAILDLAYVREMVSTGDNNSFFVIPEFDLNGEGATTKCLPMFGKQSLNIESADLFQIALKRLFAKVSVNISLATTEVTFDLLAAHLFNLPTNVRLVEPENKETFESSWVKDPGAFLSQQIEGPIEGDDIYGGGALVSPRPYEFYFYVPEYYLLPKADNTDEKYKPQMFDTSKRPVFLRLFGIYNGNSNITYDLYLGEDASDSFTLQRNTHYINSMKINGITNSKDGEGDALDLRVEVTTEQFDEVEVYGQTANCYIIGQTGTYKYPACKGVFKGGVNDIPDEMKCKKGTTLKILYPDNPKTKLDNLTYNEETCEFSFEVLSLDGGTGIRESNDDNIIIGLVYEEGGKEIVEWSWHLWIQSGTSLDSNSGFFDFGEKLDTYPNSYVMMNRNLGATPRTGQNAGTVIGAYYKYGHKEPFFDGDYRGGGESATYDWSGTDKSVTDPCPPGYRVPTSDVWLTNASGVNPIKSHHSPTLTEIWTAFEYWEDVYYPYSGYIDENKTVQSQGYGVKDTLYNKSFTIPTNQTGLSQTDALNYTDGFAIDPRDNTGPVIFTEVQYSIYDINNLGRALAQDKMEAKYSFTEKGTDIINCTIQIGKWQRSGRPWPWGDGYKYTAQYNNGPTTLTGAQLKAQNETAYNRLVSVINGSNGSNLNLVLSGWFSSPESKFDVIDLESTSYGYQVRCVKE